MANKNVEGLKLALKDKNCTLEKHSDVIEIIFQKEEDADWFQDIFDYLQRESAVCCLMPIRPKNTPPKLIFNVKDMDKLISLIKKEK
ncbi:hypothetical protein [Methanobacterium oryzae]|uniref:hypothetical protein n=1 Tax=Methanobacterium oryzae TaxID=69540 RepID=UPI003D1AE8E5